MGKQFGGKLNKAWKQRYALSPNWKNNRFENKEQTSVDIPLGKIPGLLYTQLFRRKGRYPSADIPVIPFDEKKFLAAGDEVRFIWYGHSVFLIRIGDKTLLIDPMLGPDASPIPPFSVKRFSKNTLALIDEFPPIDLVLLSHDHYDHLDLASIRKLTNKTARWFVALGVSRHLESWGISRDLITEFDWWDNHEFGNISITFTPSRHFSGRLIRDRFKSLWGGWVIRSTGENIYFSGDSGYSADFKEVGKKLGPFRFGMMECGQYNDLWYQIHMFPEETVQASLDADVSVAMPVHWGGFALAPHAWYEPINRFIKAAEKNNLDFLTPEPGRIFTSQDKLKENWWQDYM